MSTDVDEYPGPHGGTHFSENLGDFTTDKRVLYLIGLALPLGVVCAFLALILLRLISLCTNIFFFQTISLTSRSPAQAHVGVFILVIPVIGGLIVGLMARYGSDKIRGHGIPEALEAILLNGARVQPKVALLKPLSAAISIGSGGPFGAEGPIIMTGGSVGSMLGQFCHLTSSERKTLLVAGAAGGMSATFASPVAACLLAVELMLFEWKPRSLLPVAVASLAAYSIRFYLLGSGPIFPMTPHPTISRPDIMLLCCVVGLTAGVLAVVVTTMVYAAEDAFGRLPIHWMWWPMLGGLVIGIGGFFFPRALGVGYDTIGALLNDQLALKTVLGVLIVKSLIWSISLGSGTSGGVLAPLLMIGGSLGALEAHILPNEGAGFWALVAMASTLGGTIGSPFTAVIFALEVTHDLNMLAPLLAGVVVSYGLTVMVLKRSILTEKISRRGVHLSREYSVDPLELHFVRELMHRDVAVIVQRPTHQDVETALATLQDFFPVVDDNGWLRGGIESTVLAAAFDRNGDSEQPDFSSNVWPSIDEGAPLRAAAHTMARAETTRLIVVSADQPGRVAGVLALRDLLKAYRKNLDTEELRESNLFVPFSRRNKNATPG